MQRVASRGTTASIPDNCHCYTGTQEARIGSSGHEELSANLQPFLHVQDRGKSRCAAAVRTNGRCNLDSESIIPPSRVCFGYCLTFSLSEQGTELVAGFARCECRFRHGRSLHPARPDVHLLWAHGISIRLDAGSDWPGGLPGDSRWGGQQKYYDILFFLPIDVINYNKNTTVYQWL